MVNDLLLLSLYFIYENIKSIHTCYISFFSKHTSQVALAIFVIHVHYNFMHILLLFLLLFRLKLLCKYKSTSIFHSFSRETILFCWLFISRTTFHSILISIIRPTRGAHKTIQSRFRINYFLIDFVHFHSHLICFPHLGNMGDTRCAQSTCGFVSLGKLFITRLTLLSSNRPHKWKYV